LLSQVAKSGNLQEKNEDLLVRIAEFPCAIQRIRYES